MCGSTHPFYATLSTQTQKAGDDIAFFFAAIFKRLAWRWGSGNFASHSLRAITLFFCQDNVRLHSFLVHDF
jgi:hypothetical protein